ncbi:MAG TPA: ABC transporter ATP-binding protein [bacterium]|nr:ABC transporter ATP-binding protein [bacterium]HPD03323.1 ABC transporter ATP-binding protein [bacterium]HQE63420.1 ABC transporter ATP-binding protein [bacterium]HQI10569.1 ABC transporter ATP-binding protein [bacterium]HQI94971.1 ABC transporter ATP-binding protein [bacterium]
MADYPLIDVRHLNKIYDNEGVITQVLFDINLKIKSGEFVSIMGPSGSGKSTLMHILGLLDRPTSGEYFFNGHNINELSDNQLANLRNQSIGFVFQSFNLLPRTTVLDNVKLPLLYSRDKRKMDERAREVLENIGLGHRLYYLSNQISGGEKQRVAIARALVNNPQVIFADEPTGNLDSKSGIQVMQILQALNDKGTTIILVTHETFTAEHAQRIVKIYDGRLVSDEPVVNRRIAKENEFLK